MNFWKDGFRELVIDMKKDSTMTHGPSERVLKNKGMNMESHIAFTDLLLGYFCLLEDVMYVLLRAIVFLLISMALYFFRLSEIKMNQEDPPLLCCFYLPQNLCSRYHFFHVGWSFRKKGSIIFLISGRH